MKKPRKSIFNWNHIANKLTEEEIEELKAYYHTYHKKCWSHKQALKNFKGPFSSEILCAPGSFFIYEKYAIFFEVVESLLYLLKSS